MHIVSLLFLTEEIRVSLFGLYLSNTFFVCFVSSHFNPTMQNSTCFGRGLSPAADIFINLSRKSVNNIITSFKRENCSIKTSVDSLNLVLDKL